MFKKTLLIVGMLVATNASALSFAEEWERLTATVNLNVDLPIIGNVKMGSFSLKDTSPKEFNEPPASEKRLGYDIQDPVVREKVLDMYDRPDTVIIQQTVR